jgi:hypothetical protein
MTRNAFVVMSTLLLLSTPSRAAILITQTSEPTPGLSDYTTWTLTATSDVPGEYILAMDWAGEPSNNDPATGFGFFGMMNQVNPFGIPTIFSDNNLLIDIIGGERKQDSQFLVNGNQVLIPSGYAQEGPDILQAVWGWLVSPGLSVPFAQLAIPDAAQVNYRGVINVERGGIGVGEAVSGTLGIPNMPPVAHDAEIGTNNAAIVHHLFTATDDQPGLTWSNLTRIAGSTPILAPTLTPEGQFTWHLLGSLSGPLHGPYIWEATVTDARGLTDTARLTVRWTPEPSTGLLTVGGGPLLLYRHRRWRDLPNRAHDGLTRLSRQ